MTAPTPEGVDVLSPRQSQMLRDLSRGGGFDSLDPADYHASGSLWFQNRDRVIGALERKGLIDSEGVVTDTGRAALSRMGAAS